MQLEEKIIQVEALYHELDKEILLFQKASSISCTAGCSACCKSPEVEATILELLPFAWQAYKDNKAETHYNLICESNSLICSLFKPFRTTNDLGGCSDYENRALICRLFGFSFMRDKNNSPLYLACKEIKIVHEVKISEMNIQKPELGHLPFVSNYYTKLKHIDMALTNDQLPINEAMKKALEIVVQHFHYRAPIDIFDLKSS